MMEKMNKAYVGTVDRWSTMHWTDDSGEYTHVTFKNGTLRDNPWPFEPHEECYLVKKADLDAYEARIEQLKYTPIWDENQRLKARIHQLEVANVGLRDINKALGEENSKLTEENEAKAKVADLEKKLEAAKSNETYWRDRKEEEEDCHHYWLHTFDRAVKQAAEKGIHIGVCGNDEECNAGIVVVDNVKAEELEKRIAVLEKTNKNLDQKIGAADNALEYWNNTYNDIVIAGKNVGVKIDIKGKKPDNNAGFVYVTNEKALGLAYELNNIKQKHDAKWSAMTEALKAKGVEVIYMGEEDGRPIIDVKIPEIDILRKDYVVRGQTIDDLKKELETLKSRTLDNVEIRLSCGDIVWTYCDGFVHVSSGIISADQIATGTITIPKCSSCAHYVNGSRSRDIWCHKPVSKEGPGTIRRLSTEEAEGPACSDFKAKE